MISGFLIAAIKFILVISFLVLIHEAGHFFTAKAVGIKVNEFAIGFGPKLFSKQKGETKYSVRWLPLGGYVAMEGEEEASDDGKKVEAMYSSKKDLKVNGHYILYKDGTWSYQSDSVSLMVTSEDDINDIEDRIDSGDLFEITEDDLNMVAAG